MIRRVTGSFIRGFFTITGRFIIDCTRIIINFNIFSNIVERFKICFYTCSFYINVCWMIHQRPIVFEVVYYQVVSSYRYLMT
ncbi:unnamed protein product, partial [Candidula unifasciata]